MMAQYYRWKIGKKYRRATDPFETVEIDAPDLKTALMWAHSVLRPNHMQILTVIGQPTVA
jgi:hypothetical protein